MVDSVHYMKSDPHHLPFHSWHGLHLPDGGGVGTPNGSAASSPQSSLHHHHSGSANGVHGSGSGSGSVPFLRRQSSGRSSMRKLLPRTPDMDTQMSLSAKMIDRRTSTPKGSHSYGPFFLEYSLLAEYNLLQKQKMPGVYVIPSANSPLCWFGVLFLRQGLYQEGVFRFKLIIPDNYPDGDCPRLVFDDAVFHPAVDPLTNELGLHSGFKKWKRNVHHLWQVLLFARRSFYKIDVKEPMNAEAAQLYDSAPEEYHRRARACVLDWQSRLYTAPPTDDPHYLAFSPYDEEKHEPVRRAWGAERSLSTSSLSSMSSSSSPSSSSAQQQGHQTHSTTTNNGVSFIQPGSLSIFSKEDS